LTRRMLLALLALYAISAAPLAAEEPQPAASGPHALDAHAGEKPSVFAGGIGNAIITLIIFGVVVYVLGKKAWPPLLKTLNEREDAIRTSLENARREREEAEKLLAKYKQQIDEARAEATAIVEEGRRDATEVRRRMQEEARKDADEMLARAKREIRLATDTAIKDLHDQTAELAVQVAGGIIRKELRADDHKGLVTESLERMKASKN
jgi:F-type H+-transporting ATPase subunit b